jgi:hypothetical protein
MLEFADEVAAAHDYRGEVKTSIAAPDVFCIDGPP